MAKSPKRRFWCPTCKRAFYGRAWCGHRRHCQANLTTVAVKVAAPVVVQATPKQLVTNLRSSLATFEEDIARENGKITAAKVAIMEANARIDDLQKQRKALVQSLSRLLR